MSKYAPILGPDEVSRQTVVLHMETLAAVSRLRPGQPGYHGWMFNKMATLADRETYQGLSPKVYR